MDRMEDVCARLCLLTHAAWEPDMPSPITRRMAHELLAQGMLDGLVLRHADRMTAEKESRIRGLLSRARMVYELCRLYEDKGYSVLLPGDAGWPKRLGVLGQQTPLFLFASGSMKLDGRRLAAVAGSRDILPQTAEAARHIGCRFAAEGITLVTGGARGVDTAALSGALEDGGTAVVIPALPDYMILDLPGAERAFAEGRLLILCDALPDSPFSAEKALVRNHAIYALGEAAVVAAVRAGLGGSWRGASDCLKGGWTPVFVPVGDGQDLLGCRALEALGALRLPEDASVPLSEVLFSRQQTSLFE